MQGTRQHDPALKDQRPQPRTEPTTTEIRVEHTQQEGSQQDTTPAREGRSVHAELNELVLLLGILAGFVVLAGAML